MSDSDQPSIYCPACGEEHPWLEYLKGQEFQCACGHVMHMPEQPPSASSSATSSASAQSSTTFSLEALVNKNAPAAQPADDPDELEVIADADELEVIEEADDLQPLSAGDDDGDYELAVDEPDPPQLPLSGGASLPPMDAPGSAGNAMAVDDSAPVAPPGMSICQYCHKPFPFRESVCPHCGCDELGRQVKKDPKKEQKAALRVMGIPLTPRNVSILGVLFLAFCFGCYWFFTGPAAKFRYYGQNVAEGVIVMKADLVPRGGVSSKLKGFGRMSTGGSTQAGSDTLYTDGGYLAAGGHFDIYALHPASNGQYFVLDMAIQKQVLENNNSRSGYDMLLVSEDYKLKSGSNVFQGTILMESLPNKLEVTLGAEGSNNLGSIIPAGVVPEKVSWDGTFDRVPMTGDVTFTGTKGATGSFKFYIYAMDKRNIGDGGGMSVDGSLQYTSPLGVQASYTYQGMSMQLDVNASNTLFRSIHDEKVKASWSPWHQYRFKVLFPKPPKGKYELTFMDKHAMWISVP